MRDIDANKRLCERHVKPEIKCLQRIDGSFDRRYQYLRLDKNERVPPFSDEMLNGLKDRVKSEHLTGYAELGPLYSKLANMLGVSSHQILLAAGGDIAIKSIFEATVRPGDNVVLHDPSYAMFEVYARMFGAEPRMVPILSNWRIDVEKMLGYVDDRTRFMALENPNGFVGSRPLPEEIRYVAAELSRRDVFLVIDEAYIYVANSRSWCLDLVRDYPNVIICQSFSKAHGLAGMRMGYLVGDETIIEAIGRVRPMHEVSSMTALAAEWLIDNATIITEYQSTISTSKEYLRQACKELDIDYIPTETNFVLLRFPDNAELAWQYLFEQMILVKKPYGRGVMKGYCRTCISDLKDMRLLVDVLQKRYGRNSR